MSKETPDWLVEVCRRMGWDVSEWDKSDLFGRCNWKRENGDPGVAVRCDSGGTPVYVCWVCGWYEQVGDVDQDWSAADLIEAFGAAARAMNASLDASRAARDIDTDTDNTCGTLPRKEQHT